MLRTTLPLLALAVLLLPSSAPAQTTVPGGDVSGTWPLGGSPYLIDGDIAVPLGSVLILEPGVELIFQDWYELAVYGQLRAVGRVDAPVVFTSTPLGPGEPGWRGLGFYSAPVPSELAHFVIENARSKAGPPYDDRGGSIFMEACSPVIRDGVLRDNACKRAGGAIYVLGGSPVIANNRIHDNLSSREGGAIACLDADPRIVGNVITRNQANAYSGFSAISAFGGAIWLQGGQATLVNNLIADNHAHAEGNIGSYARGGGVWVRDITAPGTVMRNNTITGNSATLFTMPGQGGGVFHEGYFLEVHNSIVWGNLHGQLEGDAATVRFSDVGGGYPGAGNLDADPRFVEPGAGDYHLRATSPCRDAADPAAAPPTDFEGDPRLATAQDQGADEFHRHLYVTGDYQAGAALTVRLIGDPGSTPAVAAAGSRILDPPRTTVFGDLYLGNILRQLDLGTVPASGVVGAVVTLPAILPAVLALQGRVADRLTNLAVLLRD